MFRPWAVVATAVLVLSGCASLEDFQVEAPAWHSGNEWIYDVSYTFEAPGLGSEDEGTESGVEALRVLRHGDDVNGRFVYLVAHGEAEAGEDPFGEDAFKSLMAYRTTDLGAVSADSELLWSCIGPGACLDNMDSIDLGYDQTWPFPALQFPLEDGNSWDVPFEGEEHLLRASVQGSRDVETPAGTFDAVRTTLRGTFEEMDEGDGYEESISLDIVWHVDYSETTRSVVQSTLHAEGRFEESYIEGGQLVTDTMDVEVEIRHVLREYSLEQEEPMDAEAIWDFFDMEQYQPRFLDINSVLPPSGDGTEVIDLSLRAHNLPDDIRFEWSLAPLGGDVQDTGVGSRFYPEVEMGGVYEVRVQAIYNGTVLAQAQRYVPTHLEAEATMKCEPVSAELPVLGAQGGCEDVVVPVKQGAAFMQVIALASGPVADGELQIIAPDGEVVASGDEVYDLQIAGAPVGDYTLRYVLESGVQAEVDVEYNVYYESPPEMHAPDVV